MADSSESRTLLLKIEATTELLRSQLSDAEKAVAKFGDSAQNSLQNLDENVNKAGDSLGILTGAFGVAADAAASMLATFVASRLLNFAENSIETAHSIGQMSQALGVSTDFLQQFHFAAQQSGATAEQADTMFTRFARSVGEVAEGNVKVARAFDDLGVSLPEVLGPTNDVAAAFRAYLDAASKAPDRNKMIADSSTILGRGVRELLPLLDQGTKGFDANGEAMRQWGAYMTPETIDHAKQFSVALQSIKTVVEARMAEGVVAAGEAIRGLGEAAADAGRSLNLSIPFLNSWAAAAHNVLMQLAGVQQAAKGGQGLAEAGMNAAASSMTSGLPAHAGGMAQSSADFSRKQARDLAIDNMQDEIKTLTAQERDFTGDALEALKKKVRIDNLTLTNLQKGLDLDIASSVASGQISVEKAGERAAEKAKREAAAAAAKAEHERQQLARQDASDAREMNRFTQAQLRARQSLTGSEDEKLKIDLLSLKMGREELIAEQDAKVDATTAGTLARMKAEKQRTAILALDEEARADEAMALIRDAAVAKAKAEAERSIASAEADKSMLELDDRMAVTRKEHLALALRILKDEQTIALAKAQEAVNATIAGSLERQIAEQRQHELQAEIGSGKQEGAIKAEHEDPITAYKRQLGVDAKDMNDALQSVEVKGLQNLTDGLTAVIMGTKSLAQAFKEMAASIIADLIKIAIEKMILNALDAAGGGGGFSLGGLFGGGLGGVGGGPTAEAGSGLPGIYADGGLINGVGTGTSDSNLALLSHGEFVVNAASTARAYPLLMAINDNKLPRYAAGGLVAPRIPSMAGYGGGSVVHQYYDLSNSMITEKVYADMRSIAAGEIRSATPGIAARSARMTEDRAAMRRRYALGGR